MGLERLDVDAINEIMRVGMRGAVDEATAAIAAAVDTGSVDARVTTRLYTTDRAKGSVTIAHPAGLAIEAKHGALKKAAASVGLTVRSK